MVHDVSWVLTQLGNEDQGYLEKVCGSVRQATLNAYGPYAWEMLASVGIVVESFVLPVARLMRSDTHDAFGQLLSLKGIDAQRPTPGFAATFARSWLYAQVVRHVPTRQIHTHERGTRVWLGWVENCSDCHGEGLIESQIHEVIDRLREEVTRRLQENHRTGQRDNPDDDLAQKLLDFIGEVLVCGGCRGAGIDWDRVRGIAANPFGLLDREAALALITALHKNQGRLTANDCRRIIGEPAFCTRCNGHGYDMSKCRTVANVTLNAIGGRTLADFLRAVQPDGPADSDVLIGFFGEEIICPNCGRWLDVPGQAQNDWLCPVIDGNNNRVKWLKIEIV